MMTHPAEAFKPTLTTIKIPTYRKHSIRSSKMTAQEIASLQLKLQTAVRKHWKGVADRRRPACYSRGCGDVRPLRREHCRYGFPWEPVSDRRPRRTGPIDLDAEDSRLLVVFGAAVLAVGVGIILIARPVQGTLTLALVLSAYFAVEGVVTIMYALLHRREPATRWGWLIASGILDLAVGGLIVAGLPGSALWAIGLLVGIDLVFGGFALIRMALAGQKIDGIRRTVGGARCRRLSRRAARS
jgi:hypothetical protein